MGIFNGLASAVGYSASEVAMRNSEEALLHRDFLVREREAARIREVEQGSFAHYVSTALRARYHYQTYEELALERGIQTTQRILQDITAKAVTEWDDGARWFLTGPEGELEDPAFEALMQVLQPDGFVRILARQVFLHRRIGVLPSVVLNDGTGMRVLRWQLYTPENMNLVPSQQDPHSLRQLDLYSYALIKGKRQRVKLSVSSEEFCRYVLGNDNRWVTLTPPTPNLYRRIPVVLFPPRVNSGMWGDSHGAMLADCTIEANTWETMAGHMASGQIKVLGGAFKDFPRGQALRHAGAINFGAGESMQVLDFTTDLRGFIDTMVSRLRRQAAVSVGLNVDEFDAGSVGAATSGQALRMRYWARDRYALARRAALVEGMRELYWITLLVLYHQMRQSDEPPIEGITQLPIYDEGKPPAQQSVKLVIDVNEPQYPELQQERQAREEYESRMGFSSRAQMLMSRNPELTSLQDAEVQIKKNLQAEGVAQRPGVMALASVLNKEKAG